MQQPQFLPSAPPQGSGTIPDPSLDYFLVRFSSDPTPEDPSTSNALPWLYDAKAQVFRPFSDYFALDRFAVANGSDGATLMNSVVNLSPTDLINWPGVFLSSSYSPSSTDGSLPPYQPGGEGTPGPSITNHYGKERDEEAESLAAQGLGLLFTRLNQDGHISDDTLKLLSDPTGLLLAKYVSASLYGNYSMSEIYQDLKIKELAKTDPKYTDLRTVDEEKTAEQFRKDQTYISAVKDPNLFAPAITLQDGSDLMKYPVYKISDKFYQESVETIDWNDPKFKGEAEKILAGWYDAAIALSEADSDQAKRVANDNYQRFVDALNRKYGISLSNNAREAWNQLQGLFGGFSAKNLGDSGLMQEAMDRYLGDVRRSDEIMRENKATEAEVEQRNFLLKYGSPEQINEAMAKMDAEDSAAGKSREQFRSNLWGLTPSQETLAFYDLQNLKQKYPDLTDEELRTVRDTVVDPFGHFRSDIYRTAITNKYGIQQQKKGYQLEELTRQKMGQLDRANRQFQPSLGSYVPPDDVSRTMDVGKEPMAEPLIPPKPAGSVDQTQAPSTTQPISQPFDWNKAVSGVKFRAGITPTQIKELTIAAQRLGTTPYGQWNPSQKTQRTTDVRNWQYATEGAAVPTPYSPTGVKYDIDPATGQVIVK